MDNTRPVLNPFQEWFTGMFPPTIDNSKLRFQQANPKNVYSIEDEFTPAYSTSPRCQFDWVP